MPINSKYVFVASMDVDLDKEDLFNEVYDTEHIPNLLNVSGVHSATRVKGEPFALGGGGRPLANSGAPLHAQSAARPVQGPLVSGRFGVAMSKTAYMVRFGLSWSGLSPCNPVAATATNRRPAVITAEDHQLLRCWP